MRGNPVLIGEAPGRRTHPRAPLFPSPKNSAGYRLYKLTGLESRHEYLRTFDRANLFAEWPGCWDKQKRPKDKWSVRDARIAAASMRFLLTGRTVIFVGRRVSTAFGFGDLDFLEHAVDPVWKMRVACVPHTSGRSHWYNDVDNARRAREFFDQLLRPKKDLVI